MELVEKKEWSKIDSLKALNLFKNISTEQLTDIQKYFKITNYKPGELINVNDSGEKNFYLVVFGEIIKAQYSDTGERFISYIYKAGECFRPVGNTENVFISRKFPTTVVSIKSEYLNLLLQTHGEILEIFLNSSWNTQNQIQERTDCLFSENAKTRLIKSLEYLQNNLNTFMANKAYMDYRHQELADFCNLSRETVTRQMTILRNEGFLLFKGRQYLFMSENK
ncbi:MAG: Crp/Fnr family transcriptional regulator, partial [Candidatus Gracilibacteria bacterium]|nr:Crp/Fnr family transcriptional regulator [Candidatus Gracilibacteria bacterium]